MLTNGQVFGPDDDNRVPGELVIKLSAAGAAAVTASVPMGPARLSTDALPRELGIPTLDEILGQLGAEGLTMVFGPIVAAGSVAAELGGERVSEMGATYRVRVAASTDLDAAAQQLQQAPEVVEVEPNRYRVVAATQPNDPMFSAEWGLPKIRAPEAWDVQRGSPSVVVAVIDSGIDLDHPDLVANLVAGQDLVDITGSPPPGFQFDGDVLTRDDVPEDEVGHGTHVAGTIAAATDNSLGISGVSWECKLMPVRVLAKLIRTADGMVTGMGTGVDIAAGIRWAVDNGAHIINMSLGGYHDEFVERDAVAYAIANNVLVVAAMGNDNSSQPFFPAAYPGVMAVGAIGQDDQRASFSNTGAHIGVVAPGVDVRSTFLNGGFDDLSGTSMATPHVAGVAALIRSSDQSLTAVQMAGLLRSTAHALRDAATDPVPNPAYGSGLVDARAAVDQATGGTAPTPPTPPTPPVPTPPTPTPAPAWPGRYLKHPPMTKGADVEQWQARMVERGYPLAVDGKYGPKSKAACKAFQRQRGLDIDGIVGPITWDATFATD